MESRTLKDGRQIPVLGLGTWNMGGRFSARSDQDETDVAAIQAAIRLGLTHIDTAEMYAAGHAEELVGEAIQDVPREELFLTTKVFPQHLHYDDVLRCAEASLRRLNTDYLDLYLIHIPNPSIPLEETMPAFDRLVEEGKVRSVGVSNFDVAQLEEAQARASHPVVVNQIEYNLVIRNHQGEYNTDMESTIIPYCQDHGVVVMAYRPLLRGKLARPGYPLLDRLAEKYAKTQAQIALNWLISKPRIVTIPKSSTLAHLEEDLGALGWRLSPEDMRLLDTEFPGATL
jgi:diketogulonate reductase-like aldo/keto reductase